MYVCAHTTGNWEYNEYIDEAIEHVALIEHKNQRQRILKQSELIVRMMLGKGNLHRKLKYYLGLRGANI